MAISYYQGHDTYVVYGEETSYGAGATVAATNDVGQVQSINFSMTNNIIRTQGLGDGRNATGAVLGAYDISGSIEWQVNDFTFMQYAIGYKQGAGTVGDPWELKEVENIGYAGSGADIPSLALEIGNEGGSNDHETTVLGVVINSLTLSAKAGEVLTASCDFTGKTAATTTSLLTYNPGGEKVFVFQSGAVDISGEALQCVSFDFTINNNIQTYRNIGDRTIAQPSMGMRRYDFTMTMRKKFDSTGSTVSPLEMLDRVFGAASAPATGPSPAATYAVSLDIVEGAASGDRVCSIDLQTCYFESWSEPVTLDGGVIEVTVSGFGLAGLADSTDKVPIRWYAIA